MFITKMNLNAARRQARHLLGSPQAMHAAVLSSFAPETDVESSPGRVLWRLDRDSAHAISLFVVSPERPDLTHLVEQAGWPTQASWETRDYSPFLGRIQRGQKWAFRLVANPVHTVALPNGKSKRLGHVTVNQQTSWLLAQSETHGFTVASTEAGDNDLIVSDRRRREFRRGSSTVTLSMARFDGTLEVQDAARLRDTLSRGLGRAKAYGCGMLTLVPAQANV